MTSEIALRIIDLSDGKWKFDIKARMTDEEKQKLLLRIKYVEHVLNELMNTEIVKATDNIEFIQVKRNSTSS
ncbi:MAG: hypothetical protein NT038_03810 [Euryarchaeota archaeon]|nr:hypothetical protein [Euryarchaeota archaeon]